MRISTACGFMGGVLGYTIGSSASCEFHHFCSDPKVSDTCEIKALAGAATITSASIAVGFKAGHTVGCQIEEAVDQIWRQIRNEMTR